MSGADGPAAGRVVIHVAGLLRAQWHRIMDAPWQAVRSRRCAAVPVTCVATSLVVIFHTMALTEPGARLAWLLGGVRVDLPLWLAMARLPLSLFVPAPDLPWWGAVAQVLVVFAVAEVTLGRVKTVVISLTTTAAATLSVRVLIALGPDHVLAVPAAQTHLADTGPSAAVLGLLLCIGWTRRAPVVFLSTLMTGIVECAFTHTLSSRGHVAGTAAALVCAAVLRPGDRLLKKLSGRRTGTGEAAGTGERAGESGSGAAVGAVSKAAHVSPRTSVGTGTSVGAGLGTSVPVTHRATGAELREHGP
ncbi:hypothetical protein [Streptomyces sp. MST-110588]|uniref:hypothetical protein n=1 Tax=Streptomyces sp. MST-110588 TaxID=2833628 RepID=UPI001F5C8185|nr:hypothetical protein [Streptomyces sp. MST-110588]UNO43481.1 hypothetical protein KGS77_33385 [Streptomyces sp. MST-110588]